MVYPHEPLVTTTILPVEHQSLTRKIRAAGAVAMGRGFEPSAFRRYYRERKSHDHLGG